MNSSWGNSVVPASGNFIERGLCWFLLPRYSFVTLGTRCNLDTTADVKNKNLDIHWLRFKMMEHLCEQGSPLVKQKIIIFFLHTIFFFSGTYTIIQSKPYSWWPHARTHRNEVTPTGSIFVKSLSLPKAHFLHPQNGLNLPTLTVLTQKLQWKNVTCIEQ